MATIIFDFDHTLFDTKAFKQSVDSLIDDEGIRRDNAKEAEQKFRDAHFNNYDFKGHLESLKALGHNVSDEILERFAALDLTDHLKGDVAGAVISLKEKGHRTVLLTKGVEEFQREKLERSGVGALFDNDIFICPNQKEELIKIHSLADGETYFVNDDVPETTRVKAAFPNINCIICRRDDDKFDYTNLDASLTLINTVDELAKLIK